MSAITRTRRHVAEHYIGYAFLSKFGYVIAFALMANGSLLGSIAVFLLALAIDTVTDAFMITTIMRSRTRLKAWRMIACSLGGKRSMDRFLEKRALEYAKRGGNLEHWERRFELLVFALERIGHKTRGQGRLVDYLPRADDPLDFTRPDTSHTSAAA